MPILLKEYVPTPSHLCGYFSIWTHGFLNRCPSAKSLFKNTDLNRVCIHCIMLARCPCFYPKHPFWLFSFCILHWQILSTVIHVNSSTIFCAYKNVTWLVHKFYLENLYLYTYKTIVACLSVYPLCASIPFIPLR